MTQEKKTQISSSRPFAISPGNQRKSNKVRPVDIKEMIAAARYNQAVISETLSFFL